MQLDYSMLLNQPDAGQQLTQGIGNFVNIREAYAQARMREAAMQQAELQAQEQAAFNQAFGQAYQSKDPQALQGLVAQFPGQFEQIQKAIGIRDEAQGKALGSLGVQLSLLATQDPQAAAGFIMQNEQVLRNAGPGYEPERLIAQLQENPQALAERADNFALVALGPKTWFDVKGDRAKIDAQLRGQDITLRGQDIQQQEGAANRANAMSIKQLTLADKSLDRDVQRLGQLAAAETNDLKRQELQLKLQEKQQKLDQTRQELGAKQEGTIANMTEAARLATELVDDPALSNAVGTVSTMAPTLSGTTQDVINKANRLQSLLTVDNLKLMSGVLTDRDIAFLTNVASGLNVTEGGIKGSEKEVKRRLGEISTKMSEKLSKLQPLPTTPINPAQPAGGAVDVDALLNKYAPR